MPNIIIKFKPHYNTSLPDWTSSKGRWVGSQSQYDNDMRNGGFVSYEKMQEKVEANKKKESKYVPSEKALGIMKHAIEKADKNGNVKLDGRAIKALQEMKALKPKISKSVKLPSGTKGGFSV